MGIRISSYEISGGCKGWDHSRYKCELALPPPVAVVTHTPLHPHFLHHLAAIPYILSLWVSQVRSVKCQLHLIFSLFNVSLSPAEAQGTYQEIQMCPFFKVPSLSLSGSSFLGPWWNKVDGNEMGNSDITDLHDAVVASSWSRRTDLKFPLTNKCFSWGVSWWFSRTFTSWGSPTS